nr:MAG TPA: hypothetical protein [Caudoviricetes sp.]
MRKFFTLLLFSEIACTIDTSIRIWMKHTAEII